MERNDERNDRMLDSNDLSGAPRSTAPRDAELIGNEHPRRPDDRVAADRVDDDSADEIGEAVGGISGVLTGAALGSLGGPIGTIIGGIAGAVAGWWAGKAISEAATHVTHADESFYRTHYESSPDRLADRSYEDVRPAYQLGHLAGRNPEYQGRTFEDVETDLQRGWSSDVSARHGDWQQVRHYARDAFERGRTGFGTGAVAGAAESATTPAGTAERASLTAAEQHEAGRAGGLSGGVSSGVSGAAHRAADRLDDLKDRMDGNPASRPGPDVTDRLGYGSAGAASASAAAASVRHTDANGTSVDRPGLGDDVQRAGARTRDAAGNAWDATKRGADRVGDAAENLWDRTKDGARRLADRVEDGADDVKDRVDGNPASRPGPDATDRRF